MKRTLHIKYQQERYNENKETIMEKNRAKKKPNFIWDDTLEAYLYVGKTKKVPNIVPIRYESYNGSEFIPVEVELRIELKDKRYLKVIKENK